jgi:hypothetical protein
MLFKSDLIEKIVKCEKTQTRRLIRGVELAIDAQGNPGAIDSPAFNLMGDIQTVIGENGRKRFGVGEEYAIQPGRGKSGLRYGDLPMLTPIPSDKTNDDLIRIRLTAIRSEDVREISLEDVQAEGFDQPYLFWLRWAEMYDSKFLDMRISIALRTPDNMRAINAAVSNVLKDRPSERYAAWALTFGIA